MKGVFVDNLPKNITRDTDKYEYEYAYYKAGYKMSLDTVIASFWKDDYAVQYYNYIRNSNSKYQPLTPDDDRVVKKCVEAIAEANLTSYFKPQTFKHSVLTQKEITFQYKDIECFVKLDGIVIDHEKQTITPYDLKTTSSSVYDFDRAYLRYSYYLQAGFYMLALNHDEFIQNLVKEGYTVTPFEFLVVNKSVDDYSPVVRYTISNELIKSSKVGFIHEKVEYKGYDELIEDFKYHLETNDWRYRASVIKNGGKIDLTLK
jgi:hypothetical protein